jgi:hypothetical protein
LSQLLFGQFRLVAQRLISEFALCHPTVLGEVHEDLYPFFLPSIAFGTNIGKLGWNNRELWLMAPDGGQAHRLFEADENGARADVDKPGQRSTCM